MEQAFKIKNTTATKKIFALKKRIRAVCGGTSASKTISILIWCIDYSQSTKNELISIVSESFPHLKKGAMLDFEMIMKDRGYWKEDSWHKTEHTYTFETGSKLEFFSSDADKAHGPRRDILFLNEAQNLPYKQVDQLIVRTRKIVWMDWNPSEEFWFYTDMLPNRDDIDFITLTYKDNEALDETTIKEIESHKGNANWWNVYGLGQLGAIETRIYINWNVVDDVPHEARPIRHWLDFGYTNDPTAIGTVYDYNGGYILDENAYTKGLSNKQIADIIKSLDSCLTIADSAEPKSIDEIASYGVSILPTRKGKDSVNSGIQLVQRQRISITKRSLNLLKEYRNYNWIQDRDGKILNEPSPVFNHHMDGLRYAFDSLLNSVSPEVIRIQNDHITRNRANQDLNSSR